MGRKVDEQVKMKQRSDVPTATGEQEKWKVKGNAQPGAWLGGV
jgi:hypothetical protein